jgi:hypothetical protein
MFVRNSGRVFKAPVLSGRTPTQPKTLVIIIGQPRGGQIAWNSMTSNLLPPLNADFATLFTNRWSDPRLESLAKYQWHVDEYDDWGHVFDSISASCGRRADAWHCLCDVPDQWLGGIDACKQPGSAGTLLAFRYFVWLEIQKHKLDKKYDFFVLTRADHVYLCPHDDITEIDTTSIWVPTGENYGGWTDRHIVAAGKPFVDAMHMTEDIVCNAEWWTQKLKNMSHGTINLEVIQKTYWDHLGVTVKELNRTMFTVRTQNDPTSWSHGVEHPMLSKYGLKVKYETELVASTDRCFQKDLDKFFYT